MDLFSIGQKIDKLTKDGIPLNASVEPETLKTAGTYIVGGLALCGLITGLIVAAAIVFSRK